MDGQLIVALNIVLDNLELYAVEHPTIEQLGLVEKLNESIENIASLLQIVHNSVLEPNKLVQKSVDKRYYISSDKGITWESTTKNLYNILVCDEIIGKIE